MRPLGDLECAPNEAAVEVRVVRLDLGDQLLDEVLVVAFCIEDTHGISVLGWFRDPSRGTRRGRESDEDDRLMLSIRRWLRQRLARRLALAMRDALLPSQLG